jgi:hypothetical protein
MVEALTLLLSTVTLIFQRKDRAEDKAAYRKSDLYAELVDLHDAARTWLQAIGETNDVVRRWIQDGMPEDVDDRFYSPSWSNYRSAGEVRVRLAKPGGAVQKVLAIYAPDVSDKLSRVLTERMSFLETFTPVLLDVRQSGMAAAEGLLDDLQRQRESLAAAEAGLGDLIRGMAPTPGL